MALKSSLLHSLQRRLILSAAGLDNFSPLGYKAKQKGGDSEYKIGIFNPSNFASLAEKMDEGKTPWIAIHSFCPEVQMQAARIGPIYLAHKAQAKVLPTALELSGREELMSLNSPSRIAKALAGNRFEARYHIGQPIDLAPLEVEALEHILSKRAQGERVTPAEINKLKEIHHQLKEQASEVAGVISQMLPEKQRGFYH